MADVGSTKLEKEIKNYRITVFLFVLLDIFIAVLVGVTAHFLCIERDSYRTDAKFCLPCDSVKGHPDDSYPKSFSIHDNSTKCCVSDNKDLKELIEAFTNVWHEKKIHKDNPHFTRCKDSKEKPSPLIKLVRHENQNLGSRFVQWEKTHDRNDDMRYSNGYVTIPETGTYHIYSQVSFQFDPDLSEHPQLPKLHTIGLAEVGSMSPSGRVIAQGSNSHCKSQEPKHNSTSYIGTLYKLHKGDLVSVKVHNTKEMIPCPHLNFFGLHKV